MKTDNPLIKLERYKRICARRDTIIERIENEIWCREQSYLKIVITGGRSYRYLVEIDHEKMNRENKKRCKRLRSVLHKLNRSASKMEHKIYCIEHRWYPYEFDDLRSPS